MGITLKLKAVIICDKDENKTDGLCCCNHLEYHDNAESLSLEDFAVSAARYFENNGWRLHGSICPECQDVPMETPEETVKQLYAK